MRKSNRTAAESRHIGRVKDLPCALCGVPGPSDAHHVLEGRTPGRRSGDFLAIPLCHNDCHQGKGGIHGDKTLWRIYRKTELECLDETLNTLYGGR